MTSLLFPDGYTINLRAQLEYRRIEFADKLGDLVFELLVRSFCLFKYKIPNIHFDKVW